MIEVGKRYYFMVHAYHHWLGEVVKILGTKRCIIKNVARVQSSQLSWDEFFKLGCKKEETDYTIWPDGCEVNDWYMAVPWKHKIPTE